MTVANSTRRPPPGLAAGYAFDEGAGTTAADASGHGLTGTLTTAPTGRRASTARRSTSTAATSTSNLGNPTGAAAHRQHDHQRLDQLGGVPRRRRRDRVQAAGTEVGFQLDTTIDRGPRTIGFKLTSSSGGDMIRYGATAMQLNTWYHVAGVYNAAARDHGRVSQRPARQRRAGRERSRRRSRTRATT